MSPEQIKDEKEKCLAALYENIIHDPLFVENCKSEEVYDSIEKIQDLHLIEEFWDGLLHDEDLKYISDKLEADPTLKHSAYFIQKIRDIIRIPEKKESHPKRLHHTLEEFAKEYFKPSMIKPGPGFNMRIGLIMGVIVICVLLLIALFFEVMPGNLL
ncbi:MAG: hypothetical protein KDC24_05275 [Saprospiraceae bacterium]|nr:hypothetical protein [Saprospiraceae bacterium]